MKLLEDLQNDCLNCKRCKLSETRKSVVFGRGNINSKMLLIGEGPGEQEDIQGLPFVGPAGILLTTLLTALSINEEQYYITNIVKCRPPQNRVPFDDEAKICINYLRQQTILMKPKIIVCLGSTAMKYIVDKDAKITHIRGQWIEKKGFLILPTFHPAALLRDKSKKVPMWEDFKKVTERLKEL